MYTVGRNVVVLPVEKTSMEFSQENRIELITLSSNPTPEYTYWKKYKALI